MNRNPLGKLIFLFRVREAESHLSKKKMSLTEHTTSWPHVCGYAREHIPSFLSSPPVPCASPLQEDVGEGAMCGQRSLSHTCSETGRRERLASILLCAICVSAV